MWNRAEPSIYIQISIYIQNSISRNISVYIKNSIWTHDSLSTWKPGRQLLEEISLVHQPRLEGVVLQGLRELLLRRQHPCLHLKRLPHCTSVEHEGGCCDHTSRCKANASSFCRAESYSKLCLTDLKWQSFPSLSLWWLFLPPCHHIDVSVLALRPGTWGKTDLAQASTCANASTYAVLLPRLPSSPNAVSLFSSEGK